VTPLQASFTSGEVSPILHARVDLARYSTGAVRVENFIILPQGGLSRRPGFKTVHEAGWPVYIVPFRYSSDDTAVLIFNGTITLTVLRHDGTTSNFLVERGAPVYDVAAMSRLRYAQLGNMMFFAHPDYPPSMLWRKNPNNWVFERYGHRDGPWLSGSGKREADEFLFVQRSVDADSGIPSDWEFWGSEVFEKKKIGDMFRADIVVGGEISGTVPGDHYDEYISDTIIVKGQWEFNTSDRNWAAKIFVEKSFDNGKTWFVIKTYEKGKYEDGLNFQTSGAELEDDVLYRVRVNMDPTDTSPLKYSFVATPFVKSLSFVVSTIPTAATQDDRPAVYFKAEQVSDTNFVTYTSDADAVDWAFGAWSEENGYPSAVTFYQDRLVFAGSHAEPQSVWMSQIGDYDNFFVSDPLRDDDAITLTLAGDENDEIHSLVSMTDLLAFTGSGEWRIRGSGESGAITPAAVTAHQQTRIGSKAIQPVIVGHSVVFVQRQGTEVHSLGYNLQVDGYTGSELSILSGHIFEWFGQRREIVDLAWQRTPDSILWLSLSDGTMASCTYNPEHEVVGWARQIISGKMVSRIVSMTSADMARGSEVYAVIGDNVERMGSRFLGDVPSSDRSVVETLSVNMADGGDSTLPKKKLISSVNVFTVGSEVMIVSPSGTGFPDDGSRSRLNKVEFSEGMVFGNVMMDSGWGEGAAVRIEAVGTEPLTILAVVPVLDVGG